MRKLLLIGALALTTFISAQTTVFSADFQTTTGWLVTDRDGDAQNFGIFNLTEPMNGFATGQLGGSRSWNGVALTPDNLLLSPAITLPATGTLNLSLKVGASDVDYFEEHFAVYVIPSTGVFAGTEVAVLEQTLTTATATTVNADISAYAGQTVKLVFRHFNCTDQNIFLMDDVLITQTVLATVDASAKSAISIYPNPTSDYLNFKAKVSSVQVFDAAGRNVASSKVANNQIDVRNLAKGVYIVTFETENGTQTEKFIKK